MGAKPSGSSVTLKGIKAGGSVKMLEAGSDELSFDEYEAAEAEIRDHFSREVRS